MVAGSVVNVGVLCELATETKRARRGCDFFNLKLEPKLPLELKADLPSES